MWSSVSRGDYPVRLNWTSAGGEVGADQDRMSEDQEVPNSYTVGFYRI